MKKTTKVESDSQYNVYCKACPRHCYLYTLARGEQLPDSVIITDEMILQQNIPSNCPLPEYMP